MSQRHDLYYFLYPPPLVAETARELLLRAQGPRWPGRADPMSSDRLHITLHALGRFLNGVPRGVIDLALAAGSAMDYEPFGVRLNVLQSRGAFEAGPIRTVELAPQAGAARDLREFQHALGNTMRRMGFAETQIRSHFQPHMTLHYKHKRIDRMVVDPVAWTVMQFALVDSLYGLSRHDVLARWSLKARQQAFLDW
ncbi:2'-5' RNA ligase [Acidovorax sp. 107]|nr:2'-5' RNA ligase [Acidovorax sp. 107]